MVPGGMLIGKVCRSDCLQGTNAMPLTHRVALACFGLFLTAAITWADPAGDAAAPRKDSPVIPPAATDPFVGAFEGDALGIVIRRAQDSYIGEVKKGGKSFPFIGARRGDAVRGSVVLDGELLEFVLTIQGETVTFSTSSKMTRKTEGERPSPAPSTVPSTPAPSVANPATPKPHPADPAVSPVLPPKPAPAPVGVGEPPADVAAWALKPLEKDAVADTGRSWAGFPVGTYAVVETTTVKDDEIPKEERALLVFKGMANSKESVRRFQLDGIKVKGEATHLDWLGPGRSLEVLGFVAGKTSQQEFQVQGVKLKCDVTEYTERAPARANDLPDRLEVWTSADVELPPHILALPQGSLLVGANVVRITTLSDGPGKDGVDFRLTALKQPMRIGSREINTAVFNSTYVAGNIEVTLERHQSAQVPSGTALFVVKRRQGKDLLDTATVRVVEFGIANVNALTEAKP